MTVPRFVLWQARDAEQERSDRGEDGRGAAGPMGEGEGAEVMDDWDHLEEQDDASTWFFGRGWGSAAAGLPYLRSFRTPSASFSR
jgi:hypothetical protein